MVTKGHFCLWQNKSSEIPHALQTGIYLQCNGNSKTFVDEVNKIVLDFIWGHKPSTIKIIHYVHQNKARGKLRDERLFVI